MAVHLRLFDNPEEAKIAQGKSRTNIYPQIFPLGRQHYLKKPGLAGIEPQFLCADGRWRRYDSIPELPGSDAAITK